MMTTVKFIKKNGLCVGCGVCAQKEIDENKAIAKDSYMLVDRIEIVDEKFDDIVEFADIGDFQDTSVKFYSSGIFVRLGFSVAVHCEPDILLVGEMGNHIDRLRTGDSVAFRISFDAVREIGSMRILVVLYRSDGLHLTSTISQSDGLRFKNIKGHVVGALGFPSFSFNPGRYVVAFIIEDRGERLYRDPRFLFEVQHENPCLGLLNPEHIWDIRVEQDGDYVPADH